jgi:ABC-type sulfate transport system substrate-binding protein
MRAVSDSEPFKAFETFQSALKKGESDDIASYEDLVNQDVENILA